MEDADTRMNSQNNNNGAGNITPAGAAVARTIFQRALDACKLTWQNSHLQLILREDFSYHEDCADSELFDSQGLSLWDGKCVIRDLRLKNHFFCEYIVILTCVNVLKKGDDGVFNVVIKQLSLKVLVLSLQYPYIVGLMQERHNSIANTLELRLSCTNPLIFKNWVLRFYNKDKKVVGPSDLYNGNSYADNTVFMWKLPTTFHTASVFPVLFQNTFRLPVLVWMPYCLTATCGKLCDWLWSSCALWNTSSVNNNSSINNWSTKVSLT